MADDLKKTGEVREINGAPSWFWGMCGGFLFKVVVYWRLVNQAEITGHDRMGRYSAFSFFLM